MIDDETLGSVLLLAEHFADDLLGADQRNRCLHWSVSTALSLQVHGFRSCINAGTANFQANDNPAPLATHVGHFWQGLLPEIIEKRYIARGVLPEMHCWAVVPDLGLIVDPTTRFLTQLADDCGLPWTKPEPPNCFCGDVPPDGWFYKPYIEACVLANRLAKSLVTGLIKVEALV